MVDEKKVKEAITLLLEGIGEDVNREGLKDTPDRIARMYKEILAGNDDDAAVHLAKCFHADNNEIVLEKDIVFYSMCEHHMMPFVGKAHVAYIPNGRITGLSKIARVVECYARRLQVQERLTVQIRDCIQKALNPIGVAVVIEASHMCMQMRGVEKLGSATTTSAFTGIFLKDTRTREEFLTLISNKYR